MDLNHDLGRRIAIGLGVIALLAVVAYVAYSFVPVLVFALFLYYAVRPIYRSLERFGLPRRVRATLALTIFGVPFVLLLAYTVAVVVLETQAFVDAYDLQGQVFEQLASDDVRAELEAAGISLETFEPSVDDLRSVLTGATAQASLSTLLVALGGLGGLLSLAGGALVQLLVLLVVTYYLLIDGPRLVEWLLDEFDGSGTLREYVREVDPELSATLFGNIVNVFVTAIVAVATFYGYNAFAPEAVHVPYPALAGALAGIASLIPVVGIKLVYVPVVAALAGKAAIDGDLALFVPLAGLVAVSAVVVDFIPDFFIRAHVSGDQTHTGLLLLSYVVGPVVFGFYGLFLAPILLVLVSNALYVLVPYALAGEASGSRKERPDVRQARLREFGVDRAESTAADRPVRPREATRAREKR